MNLPDAPTAPDLDAAAIGRVLGRTELCGVPLPAGLTVGQSLLLEARRAAGSWPGRFRPTPGLNGHFILPPDALPCP